jgi:hypothetical protein
MNANERKVVIIVAVMNLAYFGVEFATHASRYKA